MTSWKVVAISEKHFIKAHLMDLYKVLEMILYVLWRKETLSGFKFKLSNLDYFLGQLNKHWCDSVKSLVLKGELYEYTISG